MGLGLLHVLDRNQAHGPVGVVDDDQPLNLVPAEEIAGLFLGAALAHGDQVLGGHQGAGRNVVAILEPHVAIGEHAHQSPGARLHHRETGNPPPRLDLADLPQGRIGVDGHGIDDHAAFVALYLTDLIGLFVDCQVAVKDTHAASLGHGDRQPALGHGIHGRGNNRDVELYLAGEPGGGVHLPGHDLGSTGFEQNVVEGKAFANLHETLHFASRV